MAARGDAMRAALRGSLGNHGATAKVEVLGPFVEGNEQSLFFGIRNSRPAWQNETLEYQ